MNTPNDASLRYLLLDGAQLSTQQFTEMSSRYPDACALYQDLGEDAARIGPWLLPITDTALEHAHAWILSETHRFAVSGLHAMQTLTTAHVVQHLHGLRHVMSTQTRRQRYYLRYADTRTLATLQSIATPEQCGQLLGPLAVWSWHSVEGQRHQLRHTAAQTGLARLEGTEKVLMLTPAQLKQLADSGRTGELLALAQQYFPAELEGISLAQRWAGALAARQWLGTRFGDDLPLRLAITVVTIRHDGANLASRAFLTRVEQACVSKDPLPLLAWPEHMPGHA